MAIAKLTERTFAASVFANAALLFLVATKPSGASGPDSYAVGIGAFLFYGLGIVLAIAALLFWAIKWLPFRLLLTAASLIATLFLAINWIDPWWW